MNTVICEHLEETTSQVVQLQPGLAACHTGEVPGEVAALLCWLDERFLKMALDAGAGQIQIEDTIESSLLERAGFFESFSAERLVENAEGKLSPPAACYQCYPRISEFELSDRGSWTCVAACGRNEEDLGLGRLRNFHMREIVLVGSGNRVREERARWMDKIAEFARALGLRVAFNLASDPFFGTDETRGRKLVQQLKELKFEMWAPIAQTVPNVAIASFNLHERFFAQRFGLRLSSGADACTGCIALGLERWLLALVAELGAFEAFDLVEGKLA